MRLGASQKKSRPAKKKRNRPGELPDFSDYEEMSKRVYFRAQLEPIRSWIQGEVLDVGSSFGLFSALSQHTTSLDVQRKWLLRGIELGNITRAVVGSALALPFTNGAFDTVLALGVIEHIPPASIPEFLDELTRVARPNGRLIVRASSPYALFAIRRIGIWDDYLHPYSPFRLRTELRQRGWNQLTWMSAGLLGVTSILPQTVDAPIPWARSFILVLSRE